MFEFAKILETKKLWGPEYWRWTKINWVINSNWAAGHSFFSCQKTVERISFCDLLCSDITTSPDDPDTDALEHFILASFAEIRALLSSIMSPQTLISLSNCSAKAVISPPATQKNIWKSGLVFVRKEYFCQLEPTLLLFMSRSSDVGENHVKLSQSSSSLHPTFWPSP